MNDRHKSDDGGRSPDDHFAEAEFKSGFERGKDWADYDTEEGELENLIRFRDSYRDTDQDDWEKLFDVNNANASERVARIIKEPYIDESEDLLEFWLYKCGRSGRSNHFVRGFCEGALSVGEGDLLRREHAADLNGFADGLFAGAVWAIHQAYWGQVRDLLSWYSAFSHKDRTDWSDLFDEVGTVILWKARVLEVVDDDDKEEVRDFWRLIPSSDVSSKLWLKGFCVGVSDVGRVLKTLHGNRGEADNDGSLSSGRSDS